MSLQIKKQQRLVLIIIVAFIVLVIACFAFWGNKKPPTANADKANFKKHTLASPLSSTTNEAHWIEKTQNAWREEQEKTRQFDKNIKALAEEKEKQNKKISNQSNELTELKAMLAELKTEITHLQTEKNKTANQNPNVNGNPFNQSNTMLPRAEDAMHSGGMELESGFIQYSASLNKVSKPRIKTQDNYVFSNTFVKARVLMGADASAGVLNQSNPDVMMFQLIDDGIMPNGKKSHLNGCFVSASVVGDISSERGKLRTERISCIHTDGTSIDTQVTGIVSDSKNGIRGRAVWRDQPMVKKAFWGSFWENIGGIGQQYATDYSVSPLGSVATIQPSKIPLAAVSGGGAGAAKMYAHYNIKRAEMYHPIIQLPPAIIVDVTFLKGFWLDGGTDDRQPQALEQTEKPRFEDTADSTSPEEKAANQFFYKNHTF